VKPISLFRAFVLKMARNNKHLLQLSIQTTANSGPEQRNGFHCSIIVLHAETDSSNNSSQWKSLFLNQWNACGMCEDDLLSTFEKELGEESVSESCKCLSELSQSEFTLKMRPRRRWTSLLLENPGSTYKAC